MAATLALAVITSCGGAPPNLPPLAEPPRASCGVKMLSSTGDARFAVECTTVPSWCSTRCCAELEIDYCVEGQRPSMADGTRSCAHKTAKIEDGACSTRGNGIVCGFSTSSVDATLASARQNEERVARIMKRAFEWRTLDVALRLVPLPTAVGGPVATDVRLVTRLRDDAFSEIDRRASSAAVEAPAASPSAVPPAASSIAAPSKTTETDGAAETMNEDATLAEVEKHLSLLERAKEPWGESLLPTLIRSGAALRATIERRQATNKPIDVRLQSLRARWSKLADSHPAKRAVAEADAQKTQQNANIIATGRQLALSKLRSPSTAKFVGDTVVLECASGFRVTAHDVDAQNAYGAAIRNRMCMKFNPATRRVIVSRTEDSQSIDSECAGAFGTANPMLTDCKYLDGWTLTAGF